MKAPKLKKIGCCYHPKLPDDLGLRVAESLRDLAAKHVKDTWVASAWDEDAVRHEITDTDLLVCVGGDGTVLRAAHAAVPHETLLLGVNMGRLGFLAELDVAEAVDQLPEIAKGAGRVEERAMLHAEVVAARGKDGEDTPARHEALNDVVIGRRTLGRTVQVLVRVNGALMADMRADGVIVATATGSTAYSLSAGGPVLDPESTSILFTPLAPHLTPRNSIVLPQETVIEVQLAPGEQATFSVDGVRDLDLGPGETVRVSIAEHRARFLRLGQATRFYERLARRFNWLSNSGGKQSTTAKSKAAVREAARA